jgi:CRP-like cAMP-binding protein
MFRNLTLAIMHQTDIAALEPFISEREVVRGETLIDQGAWVETVAFLASASVINTITFRDGRTAETFDMGAEGVTGLSPFLANARSACGVEVQAAGTLFEIPAAKLRALADSSHRLRQQLISLSNDYLAQASIGIACAAYHKVTPRLASLILLRADPMRDDRLNYTQEDLATRLGVERPTISRAAGTLKSAGAISYLRGQIRIIDRAVLKRLACECHEMRNALL